MEYKNYVKSFIYLFIFCFSSLSVAETHAGDDRSDAGTDEDEIWRVKERREARWSRYPGSHHLYLHTTNTTSSSLQTSIHQLFRSSPLMFFLFCSTSCQDFSYNSHMNLTDCRILSTSLLSRTFKINCLCIGWLLLTHLLFCLSIMVHRFPLTMVLGFILITLTCLQKCLYQFAFCSSPSLRWHNFQLIL